MSVLAILVGVVLVGSVILDLTNTLVNTHTNRSSWWLTNVLYRQTWRLLRLFARHVGSDVVKEGVLATFAPVSILLLLIAWIIQQIVGFGLIWWGLGGVDGASSLTDAIYYSGVVYFTLGFGEIVPTDLVPRFGTLAESFCGVLTSALVIGYLPSLYGAYSERERRLMTLDAGTDDRITPTALVIARSPGADPTPMLGWFKEWEDWITGLIETHSAFPMLSLFRSKHQGQNWVTALGLVADAALHCQIIVGMDNREPYWCLRRAIILFEHLTEGVDLTPWQQAPTDDGPGDQFVALYAELEAYGFDLVPFDDALAATRDLRQCYAPHLECLIDTLMAPRGFWGQSFGSSNLRGSMVERR